MTWLLISSFLFFLTVGEDTQSVSVHAENLGTASKRSTFKTSCFFLTGESQRATSTFVRVLSVSVKLIECDTETGLRVVILAQNKMEI